MNTWPQELHKVIAELFTEHKTLYLLDLKDFKLNDSAPGYGIIRPLTRREFNLYSKTTMMDPEYTQTSVINDCLLYPKDLEQYSNILLPGIDKYIVSSVNLVSGFGSESILIDGVLAGRNYAKTLEAAIIMYICKAFVQIKPNEVEEMNFEEQMNLMGMAETIIGQPLEYEKYLFPEKFNKKKKKVTTPRERNIPIPSRFENSYGPMKSIEPEWKNIQDHNVSESLITKDNFIAKQKELEAFLGG